MIEALLFFAIGLWAGYAMGSESGYKEGYRTASTISLMEFARHLSFRKEQGR